MAAEDANRKTSAERTLLRNLNCLVGRFQIRLQQGNPILQRLRKRLSVNIMEHHNVALSTYPNFGILTVVLRKHFAMFEFQSFDLTR